MSYLLSYRNDRPAAGDPYAPCNRAAARRSWRAGGVPLRAALSAGAVGKAAVSGGFQIIGASAGGAGSALRSHWLIWSPWRDSNAHPPLTVVGLEVPHGYRGERSINRFRRVRVFLALERIERRRH